MKTIQNQINIELDLYQNVTETINRRINIYGVARDSYLSDVVFNL